MLKYLLVFLLIVSSAFASSTTFDGANTKYQVTDSSLDVPVYTIGEYTYRTGSGESSSGVLWHKTTNNIEVVANSSTLYRWRDDGWSITDINHTIPIPSLNVWHHMAVAYDSGSTSNVPIIFLDAVAQSTTIIANPVGTYATGTGALILGNDAGQTLTWGGRIANSFLYNRLLSAAEIAQIQRFGPQTIPNGLLGCWPLGARTTQDVSGNGKALTLTIGTGSHNEDGPPVNISQGGWFE